MGKSQKAKDSSLEEPKKRLERLLILSTICVGYFFIYIYQNMLHIKVALIDLQTLIKMPIIALVVYPLIHYLIVKPDPLQRSPSQNKAIRFFQNEFPSKYILERCERCKENRRSCKNYISKRSNRHITYWFDNIFHGEIEKSNPQMVRDTFERGYFCKLLYYLSWVLGVFAVLGIIIIVLHHAYLFFISNKFRIDLTAYQILFLVICTGIVVLIKFLNKPDENFPSGCWHAWREINRMHVDWLIRHGKLLTKLICKDNQSRKKFRMK